jgi:four helix bundle protein
MAVLSTVEQLPRGCFVAEGRAEYKPSRIRTYRDLKAWQAGMDLTEACYRLTGDFPSSEIFGLTGQIRRASSSIPANISEGWGRDSSGEFDHALSWALGSPRELETHLLIATRLRFGREAMLAEALAICDDLGKMLYALKQSVVARREVAAAAKSRSHKPKKSDH